MLHKWHSEDYLKWFKRKLLVNYNIMYSVLDIIESWCLESFLHLLLTITKTQKNRSSSAKEVLFLKKKQTFKTSITFWKSWHSFTVLQPLPQQLKAKNFQESVSLVRPGLLKLKILPRKLLVTSCSLRSQWLQEGFFKLLTEWGQLFPLLL